MRLSSKYSSPTALRSLAFAAEDAVDHRASRASALQHHFQTGYRTCKSNSLEGNQMKKLTCTAILTAAAASQVAGCFLSSDPIGNPIIIADLALSNEGPGALLCFNDANGPHGRDAIRINARLTGTQSGDQFLFGCTSVDVTGHGVVTTQETSFGYDTYDIWVDFMSDRGFPDTPSEWVVIDSTNPTTVDVSDGSDIEVIADLVVGNGFFNAIWSITDDSTGNPVTQCPPGGEVTIDSTIVGSTMLFDDSFPCVDGFNDPDGVFSNEALPLDDYVVSADLFVGPDAVTVGPTNVNATIVNGNEYVDLNIDLVVP